MRRTPIPVTTSGAAKIVDGVVGISDGYTHAFLPMPIAPPLGLQPPGHMDHVLDVKKWKDGHMYEGICIVLKMNKMRLYYKKGKGDGTKNLPIVNSIVTLRHDVANHDAYSDLHYEIADLMKRIDQLLNSHPDIKKLISQGKYNDIVNDVNLMEKVTSGIQQRYMKVSKLIQDAENPPLAMRGDVFHWYICRKMGGAALSDGDIVGILKRMPMKAGSSNRYLLTEREIAKHGKIFSFSLDPDQETGSGKNKHKKPGHAQSQDSTSEHVPKAGGNTLGNAKKKNKKKNRDGKGGGGVHDHGKNERLPDAQWKAMTKQEKNKHRNGQKKMRKRETKKTMVRGRRNSYIDA